ncbi:MAG: OmpA family protein [Bacteroidales bacterium]|nr:OmpA family protein [Bacteroidales bacterium]
MKRVLSAIILCALLLCAYGVQAQSKTSKTSSSKTSSSKKKPVVEQPAPVEVQLPYNSNDCIFAIDLQADNAYGPTTAPKGAGRVQDVMRDKNNPNVFEFEHNSTWYKFEVPYSGNLEIEITPTNVTDDYDFLVYKYTDVYFSNRLIEGKIKPVAANLSSISDSVLAAAAAAAKPAPKTGTAAKPATTTAKPAAPKIGMSKEGTRLFVDKKSFDCMIKSIPVRKGEIYYIALDNLNNNGAGHTIKVSVKMETINATMVFYDPAIKKTIDVDLLILEKNTNNRAIVKNSNFKGGKVQLVPGYDYTMYARRDGYFGMWSEFNANEFKSDTLKRFIMKKCVKGTNFPLSEIYFDDDQNLLPESDAELMNYVTLVKNHPEVSFKIKGYVQSYGVDMLEDQKASVARAQAVKDYLIKNGVDEKQLSVEGMTQNEIKRSATAALNKGAGFKDVKIDLIITNVAPLK